MTISSINPATGEKLGEFATLNAAEIESRLATAESAFSTYRRTSASARANILSAAADILETETDSLARIITLEMGKPIGAARAEDHKCDTACR